jgi:hypothetical protein
MCWGERAPRAIGYGSDLVVAGVEFSWCDTTGSVDAGFSIGQVSQNITQYFFPVQRKCLPDVILRCVFGFLLCGCLTGSGDLEYNFDVM